MVTVSSTNQTLAQNYFATKQRTPYYEIRYITDCCPQDGWAEIHPFTDEEMAQLLALREKYGHKEFINHLEEVFDEDRLCDLVSGEIIDLDLDNPQYCYNFTCHEISSEGVTKRKIEVALSDSTYQRLLALHLHDKYMNINRLKYADKELYDTLTFFIDLRYVDDEGYYQGFNPYTVTMDELKEDAAKIIATNAECFNDDPWMVCYPLY